MKSTRECQDNLPLVQEIICKGESDKKPDDVRIHKACYSGLLSPFLTRI